MKILHTADWHLGKKLEQFSRLEEQKEVLLEICEIAEAEEVDAVLIAGDLFDTFNPPTEAVDLFYKTLKRLTNNGRRLVVAIAGNHDSPERIEAPDPLARECGIVFSGFPTTLVPKFQLDTGLEIVQSAPGFIEVKIPNCNFPLRLIVTPYANEHRMRSFLGVENPEEQLRQVLEQHWQNLADQFCDEKGVNLLVTHLLMMEEGSEIPLESDDERSINHVGGAQAIFSRNVPRQIQYVALGHLHRPHVPVRQPSPMVYSGSPISYSFSEAEQEKCVYLLDALPNEAISFRRIPLTNGRVLIRHRALGTDQAIQWLSQNPNVLVELTLVTDNYISAADRKAILQAHDGIVALIPEILVNDEPETLRKSIDLGQEMDELFKSYFKSKLGQDVNQELLDMFQEIKAEKI